MSRRIRTSRDVPWRCATSKGKRWTGLYFRYQRALVEARELLRRHGVQVFESDLKPSDRYLMERFISAAFHVSGEARERDTHLELRNPVMKRASFRPRFQYAVLDIETSGFDGQLYSIAVSAGNHHRVFMVTERTLDAPELALVRCRDEREVLRRFFQWTSRFDPDLILGWNVLNFDLDFLERRCEALGLQFRASRVGEKGRASCNLTRRAGCGSRGCPGASFWTASTCCAPVSAPSRASSSSMLRRRCSAGESACPPAPASSRKSPACTARIPSSSPATTSRIAGSSRRSSSARTSWTSRCAEPR